MPTSTFADQYVLLPVRGLHATAAIASSGVRQFLGSLDSQVGQTRTLGPPGGAGPQIRVVDSIGADGAKLVELSPQAALALRSWHPELRVVPVVYYSPAVVRRPQVESGPQAIPAAPGSPIKLRVVSQTDGGPVAGATVVVFADFAARSGAQGVTDGNGEVLLALGGPRAQLERVYVYPVAAFWSLLQKAVTVASGTKFSLQPLNIASVDGLRQYYGRARDEAGAGVTVAVVDTGVANHPDLKVSGGANTVPGEDPKAFGDNGEGHGTHVAGIIAARGHPPRGLHGVAPGATLRSYRVFGQGSTHASSFAIAKGIDLAVTDGCDLINMSLGGGSPDPVLTAAVEDARVKGCLCIIAAGNGGRKPVAFPASDGMAIAVSAMGRMGTFPETSAEADDIAGPFGTDRKEFIATFSNVGDQVALTGPGVGIMSTVPTGYAVMSGTSMACPAVTGAAARSLAASPVLHQTRDSARSAAIVSSVLQSGVSHGFPAQFEGHGLPRPPA